MASPEPNAQRRLSPGSSPQGAPSLESMEKDADTPNVSVSGLGQRNERRAGKAMGSKGRLPVKGDIRDGF